MTRELKWTMVLVLLVAVAAPMKAHGLYLGGGLQSVSIGADLDKWADFESKIGFNLNFGIQFKPSYALDIHIGYAEPEENMTWNTVTEYTWFEIGPKFTFGVETGIQPSVTFGLGSYNLDVNVQEFEGTGAFFGFGIEEVVGQKHSVGFFVRYSYWIDDPLDVSSLGMLLNYSYIF